jgi:hypothetical protein
MIGGHGHVYPRPDGMKARCGGPALCAECGKEAEKKWIQDRRKWLQDRDRAPIDKFIDEEIGEDK